MLNYDYFKTNLVNDYLIAKIITLKNCTVQQNHVYFLNVLTSQYYIPKFSNLSTSLKVVPDVGFLSLTIYMLNIFRSSINVPVKLWKFI